MANVSLHRKTDLSTFRKLAVGSWQDAYDPSVYGYVTVRMDAALAYLEDFRQRHDQRITVTHLVSRAVAEALKLCPDANAMLRFNRIYLRDHVDLLLQVAMEAEEGSEDADLSAVKIPDADKKTLLELATCMSEGVAKVRARQDEHLEATRKSLTRIPNLFMNAVLKLISFLTYGLNINLSWAGVPKDAFGSAFITSIGSLGLEAAFVPLLPYSRVPIFVAPGAVREEAIVKDGVVVAGKVMTLAATFDHRFIDGVHGAFLARTVKEWLEDPKTHFGPIEA